MSSPIDLVLTRLDRIIADAIVSNDRIGLFASLYRRVTARIKSGVESGFFEDGPRMERLDSIFADRYFLALDQYRSNDPLISASWKVAFDSATSTKPIILQHLLLGINAHINIDLAVAAVQTSPGIALSSLKTDFMRVNAILASLVPEVESELGRISPLLYILDEVGGHFDNGVINFSIDRARDAAWAFATLICKLDPIAQQLAISQYEHPISALARKVLSPDPPISWMVNLVAVKESRNVAKAISVLNS